MSQVTRVVLHEDPFSSNRQDSPWGRGRLDARFIAHPSAAKRPLFCVYYLDLQVEGSFSARIHVTADERYAFYLDGNLMARGSERGDQEHWFYETYDILLGDSPANGDSSGRRTHRLAFLVWSLGNDHAPLAQFTVQHGFLCIADQDHLKDKLTTGHANWKCMEVDGIEIVKPTSTYGVGDRFKFHGDVFNLTKILASDEGLEPMKTEIPTLPEAGDLNPIRVLRPGLLPAMHYQDWKTFRVRYVGRCQDTSTASVTIRKKDDLVNEHEQWNNLFAGGSLEIPPHQRLRCIVDLDNYACSYWYLTTSNGKGSHVRINFQEALIKDFKDGARGNRDEVEGGHFVMMWSRAQGFGDEIVPGGTNDERYSPYWWCAGRFVEIYVETADQPLTLSGFRLEETHYPIHPPTSPFHCSDEQLNKIVDICIRTLQMDAHETFFDCPYYEQLQYVGDSRIESMIMMAMTDDRRLPAKATDLYRWSIGYRGMTQSRYPSRNRQYIPPFSIWWILMVHDQHVWQGDRTMLRQWLPSIRTVLSFFQQYIDHSPESPGHGLMKSPDQWNFVDWIPDWKDGVPPGGADGFSLAINMQLVLALEAAVELETVYGNYHSQRPLVEWLQELRTAVKKTMTHEGYLPDAVGATTVSEQPHALAVLSSDRDLRKIGSHWYEKPPEGSRATYYYQHYRHEALARLGKYDQLLDNIRREWGGMVKNGLRTTIEMPDPGRSDCHAWSAHPVYHLQTKILGLSPLEANQFELNPHLDDLDWAEGYVSTGRGPIHVRVEKRNTSWQANLVVPEGVSVSIPKIRGVVVGPKTVTVDAS